MTTSQVASAMRRIADALDRLPARPFLKNKPEMSEEAQLGGLITLHYLSGLITAGNRDTFDRPELLVFLDLVANDPEIFQQGLYQQVKSTFDRAVETEEAD